QVGPLSGCFNADCPTEYHVFDIGINDPAALPLLNALETGMKGQRMLIQEDYCDDPHVQYLTYDRMHTYTDGTTKELQFSDGSRECWRYVKPRPGNYMDEHMASLPLGVFWSCIRYTALVDNPRIAAFASKGGRDKFIRDLAWVSGKKRQVAEDKIA